MRHEKKHERWVLRRFLAVSIVTGLAPVAVADNIVVKKSVDVKPDTDPLSDAIETVPVNSQLQVLDHKGGWVHVKTPSGKVGFVSEDDLPSNVSVAVTGTGNASGLTTSAASKGLEEDAEEYSKSKNLNKQPLDTMISWGDAIGTDDLKAFDAAGHVGSPKHR